jgi:acyl-coenzyme A thioesterase PaaI-like protein
MTTDGEARYWDVPDRLIDGPWAAKRRLAAHLRELAALCVTTDAPQEVLEDLAARVGAVRDELHAHPGGTFKEKFPSLKGPDDFAVFTDRGTLVGLCNPYAPPMKLDFEGDEATASVTFGPVFEGAPGFVHGGIVAAAFDQLFGYLQLRKQTPSLTRSLTVRYHRPTPIATELLLRARVSTSEGRKHHVEAELRSLGVVTADAEGTFICLEGEAFRRLFDGLPASPAR